MYHPFFFTKKKYGSIYTHTCIPFQQQPNMADRSSRSKGSASLSSGLQDQKKKKTKSARDKGVDDTNAASGSSSVGSSTSSLVKGAIGIMPNYVRARDSPSVDPTTSTSGNTLTRPNVGGKGLNFLSQKTAAPSNDASDSSEDEDVEALPGKSLGIQDDDVEALAGKSLGIQWDDIFGLEVVDGQAASGVQSTLGVQSTVQSTLGAQVVSGGQSSLGAQTSDNVGGSQNDNNNQRNQNGSGRGGPTSVRRHRKLQNKGMKWITKPAIKRLARKGGVVRISGLIYEPIRDSMEAFLRMICRDAIALMELQRKKTLTIEHITYALRRLNKRTIY